MLRHEDDVDAVIICGIESCEAASTVQYCTPPRKFFSLNGGLDEEELLSELRLKRAETVLCQQDAFAVIAEAEAGLAVLHGKSVLQPLAELACDRAVKRHCVLVNDNLPVFAAGVGAVACQTVKLRVKIGVDLLHAQRLLSLCHHTQFRAARQYCYFPQRVI